MGSRDTVRVVANIFISFIGAGVLGLPYAFKTSGLAEGTLVMIFVAYCSVKAMLLLIDCKYQINLVLKGDSLSSVRYSKGKDYSPLKKDDDEEDDRSSKCSSKSENSSHSSSRSGSPAVSDIENGNGNSNITKRKRVDSKNEKSKWVFQALRLEKSSSRSGSPITNPKDGITYSDVAYAAIGHGGRLLIDVCLIVSQIGFCVAYLIFICENLKNYFTSYQKRQFLIVLLPPLFFLTLIKDLSSLAIASIFAQVSNLLAFLVVFWFDFEHLHLATEAEHRKEFSIDGFPFFFCMAIFCYEGAGMILSLEHSVPDHIRSSFKRLFVITISCVTFLYISFGTCGYLSFGPETSDIITTNIPHESKDSFDFARLVQFCLSLGLFLTYPVMMFPVTNLLQQRAQQWLNSDKIVEHKYFGMFIRLCCVTITGIVAILVPKFALVMSLIGATCCTFLAFIIPAVCHIMIFKETLTNSQRAWDYFLVAVGVIGCLTGTWDAVKKIHAYKYPHSEPWPTLPPIPW